MAIEGLKIIGERINPGFASSKELLDKRDVEGIKRLAENQTEKNADYLTINVGDLATSEPDFLVDVTRAVQSVSPLPLSFDYPNADVQRICLHAYDPDRAGGAKPIVNSISELRWDMVDVLEIRPARVILMASERVDDGKPIKNETAEEVAMTARRMTLRLLDGDCGLTPDDLIVDVSVCPIATDTEGELKRAIDAIRMIGSDPAMAGVHMVVGLSNVGIMLPKTAVDGRRLSVAIESAFLTETVPYGLDMILGTPGRNYKMLGKDDFIYQGFLNAIDADGFESLMCLRELYVKGGE